MGFSVKRLKRGGRVKLLRLVQLMVSVVAVVATTGYARDVRMVEEGRTARQTETRAVRVQESRITRQDRSQAERRNAREGIANSEVVAVDSETGITHRYKVGQVIEAAHQRAARNDARVNSAAAGSELLAVDSETGALYRYTVKADGAIKKEFIS
jgi:hypothetical protein